MAVVTVKQRICDVCQDPDKPASRYNISSGGRRAAVDLCVDDAAPLEALLDQQQPGRRASVKKLTAAEIAAAKRTHKRTAKRS